MSQLQSFPKLRNNYVPGQFKLYLTFNRASKRIFYPLKELNKFKMNTDDYSPFSDSGYLEMWGINPNEELHFYYDESNNCRKFSLNSEKENFNHDYTADFVLAGIATKNEFRIPFEELKTKFYLQNNVTELKSKSLFRGKDFLQCMDTKYANAYLKLFSDYDLFLHYSHVNNFFYTIVEILDSIASPQEMEDFGFDYFKMKSTFYTMLEPNIENVIQTMITYSYPNIKTSDIEAFCNGILNCIKSRYKQTPEEKFISGMLKRASKSNEMIFIQNNEDYVMQENYAIFYVDPILKFKKSTHHFDEELSIQEEVANTVSKYAKDLHNYEFVNSKTNTLIQLSDLTAGLVAKLISLMNTTPPSKMHSIIADLSNTQVENCLIFNKQRIKSNNHNPGLLHSTTAIGLWEKIDSFFNQVQSEHNKRVRYSTIPQVVEQ